MWRTLLIVLLLLALLLADEAGRPASAVDDGHLWGHLLVVPFIEDVPNNPFAFVPVYDCEGQGHTHDAIISAAVTAWNSTGRVRFFYTQGSTTPCDAAGFPTTEGRISVIHTNDTPRADYGPQRSLDSFRDNDVGTEGDIGMYPLSYGRIRLNPGSAYHTAPVLVHELGHAAGLTDLYVENLDPCDDSLHPHNLDTTIMDCTIGPDPGQHDIDNLDALYKRAPERPALFSPFISLIDPNTSLATVGFRWTDKSFNEQYQYIGMDNDLDGVGEGIPLVAPRDAESAEWGGLQPSTIYCFLMQTENAYHVFGLQTSTLCITTASLPQPTPTPVPTATPTPCPPEGCPVGGIAEAPGPLAVAAPGGSTNALPYALALVGVAALLVTLGVALRLRRR